MIEKITNYSRKFHTIRAYQVIITFLIVSLTIAVLFSRVFSAESYVDLMVYYPDMSWNLPIIPAISLVTNSYLIFLLAPILIIFSGAIGVVFVWLNRPKITLLSLVGIFSVLLTALLIKRHVEFADLGHVFLEPSEILYILLSSLLVLVVFVILAIVSTKIGARPSRQPRPQKVLKVEVVENTSISEADEIRKLKTLLDDGIITEDEFNQKKKKILGL